MDQQSTSLWHGTTTVPAYTPLAGELHADVVIIGGGITGVTAALLLAERGKDVVLLERETLTGGETGNTTAHITVALDTGYHYVKRKYSTEEAKLVADAQRSALEKITELVERHSIDCHFRRVPAYSYTEKRKYVSQLKNEAAAAREAGLDAQWTTDVPLPFETRGAILWPDQAQFHPGEYIAGLAKQAVAAGVRIFDRTLVTAVHDGEPCVVETDRGARVTAAKVFQATNVPIAGFNQVHLKAAPYRTYVIAYRATKQHPVGLFWDTADPYHYTRLQETNDGTFLIVGGEDHRVGEEEETENCFARLDAYARDYFGEKDIAYRWSGQIIEPHGGLPLIGGTGNLYVSSGYSGQGMTLGTVGAMLVTDLITGVANPWAEVFDLHRQRPHMTTREFITENLTFPERFVADRIASADVEGKSTEEVKAGEGKIIKVEDKKIAAYRDEGGTLHCVSPVCTHMRCDVKFNDAEKTWDCPCHGSRFKTTGEVLNGPAREPLEKIEL